MMAMSSFADSLAELILSRLTEAEALDELNPLIARLQLAADQRNKKPRVISAVELTEAQQADLKAGLEADEIEFVVDPEVLGGIVLEHEGRRTDLSWRRRVSTQYE